MSFLSSALSVAKDTCQLVTSFERGCCKTIKDCAKGNRLGDWIIEQGDKIKSAAWGTTKVMSIVGSPMSNAAGFATGVVFRATGWMLIGPQVTENMEEIFLIGTDNLESAAVTGVGMAILGAVNPVVGFANGFDAAYTTYDGLEKGCSWIPFVAKGTEITVGLVAKGAVKVYEAATKPKEEESEYVLVKDELEEDNYLFVDKEDSENDYLMIDPDYDVLV